MQIDKSIAFLTCVVQTER